MTIDWAFPKQVFIALALVALAAAYPLAVYGTPEILAAVSAGAVLATLNVLTGFASIEYSRGRSTTVFFKVVLGGMGLRLLAMAIALVVCMKVLRFHALALVGSLGVLYMVYLALEVLYIQKKVSEKS
jgi:hypothetical protein